MENFWFAETEVQHSGKAMVAPESPIHAEWRATQPGIGRIMWS
jgi:hypothetical protein